LVDMRHHLRAMFEDVRGFLLTGGLGRLGVVQQDVKGDVTVVSDRPAASLLPIASMVQGQSLVAACTPALHAAILSVLNG